MAKTWYPIINEDLCSQCYTCSNFCEHDVFVVGDDGFPKVENPDNCVEFCRGCAKICPTEAITFYGDTE